MWLEMERVLTQGRENPAVMVEWWWWMRAMELLRRGTEASLLLIHVVHSVTKSDSLWSHGLQHTRLPSPSLSPGVCSDSWPLGWWCYLTISSSAACHPPPPATPYATAFNLSQHQGLFQWAGSSHQMAKVLELQLQHQSLQWIFRPDFL